MEPCLLGTLYVDRIGLDHRDLPASAFGVLGVKVYITPSSDSFTLNT